MPKSIEKVFIVWGGNKPLADTVGAKLDGCGMGIVRETQGENSGTRI